MAKQLIATDIDDVLAANAEGFVAFSNQQWGMNLRPEDYSEQWAKVWQVDVAEVDRRSKIFHESQVVATYRHLPDGVAALERLKQDYDIVAVTSRQLTIRDSTRDWLDKYYGGIFDDVVFAGIFDGAFADDLHLRTKADVFRRLKPAYVIDDQLKHCAAAADLGIKTVLFGDYPWNQVDELPPGVTRCRDWAAVEEYFDA